jgi:hypothetical protein
MKLLLTIRLSWFFLIFLAVFTIASYLVEGTTFLPSSLALFSVNSFLYGFYISPILNGQKQRIDDLTKAVRAEANGLFDMLIRTKKLPKVSRNKLQAMFEVYMVASFNERRPAAGEAQYEELISYCLEYKGKDPATIEKILNGLVANQQNRSQISMLLGNRVYSNEWWIMLILFGITIGFVLLFDVRDDMWLHLVKALLCTGLSMLMINLLKFSTLTHKRAKNIWDPLDNLTTSRFRSIDRNDNGIPDYLER